MMIKMEMTKERKTLLIEIADDILSKMKEMGYTGFEGDIEDKTWEDAFIKDMHPLVDESIAEYKLGGFDLFYMGVWFGLQTYSFNL